MEDPDRQMDSDTIPHQSLTEDVIETEVEAKLDAETGERVEAELVAASDVAVLADLPAFTDPPSAGEMAALRTSHNKILEVLRDSQLIPTA